MKSKFHACGIAHFFKMFLVLVFLSASLFSQEPDKKLAIPDAAARKKAAADIKEIYGDQFAKAKSNKVKIELAQQLFKDAEETEDDPASLYTLLRIARDIAIGGEDFNLAMKSIDLLDAKFEVDAPAMKIKALLAAGKSVKTKEANKQLALEALAMTQEAIAQDDYNLAKKLSAVALSASRKSRDGELVKQAVAVNKEIDTIKAQYARVKLALESLETKPTHPGANLTVGKFRCYYKGNWEEGLSMLILGSDAKLKELATTELKGPTSKTELLNLGHGWWDLGDSLEGIAQNNVKLHSGLWYRKVLPKLTGIAKKKVELRLKELEGIASSSVSSSGQAAKPRVPTKGLVAYWSFDGKSKLAAKDSVGNNHLRIIGAQRGKGVSGTAIYLDGIDDLLTVNYTAKSSLNFGNNLNYTVAAWVYAGASQKGGAGIFGKCNATGSENDFLLQVEGGKSVMRHEKHSWQTGISLDHLADRWHHIAFTFSGGFSGGTITAYFDGKPVNTGTHKTPGSSANGFVVIGSERTRTSKYAFKGAIDELYIYNRALSAKEIGTLIKSVTSGSSPKTPTASKQPTGKHPAGAVQFQGHWYMSSSAKVPWTTAAQQCQRLGGQLVCIETAAEAQFVARLARGNRVWLGGYKNAKGQWMWVNGKPITFTTWRRGEPSGRGENRLELHPEGGWNDGKNNGDPGGGVEVVGFICEWEK